MKKSNVINRVLFSIMMIMASVSAWAQEKKVDINVESTTTHSWYTNPWIWVVGGAVFILLLVALVRGNTSKE